MSLSHYATSPRKLYDIVLTAADDEIVVLLCDFALDILTERDALRGVLSSALEQLHELDARLDRSREDADRLRRELRALRSASPTARHREAAA